MQNSMPIRQSFGVSGSLWPIHLKPLDGEILSSWLSRVAHAQGLTLRQFLKIYLPNPVGVGFDIDAITEPTFFKAIVEGTGLSYEATLPTTFLPENGQLYSGDRILNARWIIPLRLKSPQNPGIPFCPSCLSNDSDPYYRKHWRFGFFTICPSHGLLESNCSYCGHPFTYQDNDRAKRIAISNGLSRICHQCKRRLSASITPPPDKIVSSLTRLQSEIMNAMEVGWIQVPNRGLVHVYNYLLGLHQLASIFHNQIGDQVVRWVGQQSGIPFTRDSVRASSSLEKQSTQTRAFALFFADWLIQEWPSRLISMMKNLNLSPSGLLAVSAERPFWLTDPGIEALWRGSSPPLEQEIAEAQKYLRKRIGWSISRAETIAFMRTGKIPQIKKRRSSPSAAAKLAFKISEELEKAAYERKRSLSPHLPRQLYLPFQVDAVEKIFNEDREAGHQYVHELPIWQRHIAEE